MGGLLGIEFECLVDGSQGVVGLFLADEYADDDLAGGDILDIDVVVGECPEHSCGDAGVGSHTEPDDAESCEAGGDGSGCVGMGVGDRGGGGFCIG